MPSPNQSELDHYFQAILERKFGGLLKWQAPKIEQTIGPYQPEIFVNYGEKRDALVLEARDVLGRYLDQQVLVLYDKTIPDTEKIRPGWQGFLSNEINNLQRRKPVWYCGGFGHPDYKADFEYWGQMENFSINEGLLLSVGVEPKHFSESWLWKAKEQMERERLIAPVEFLVKRHEQFLRKYPRGTSGLAHASPQFLWNWFEEVGMAVHEGFRGALHQRLTPREARTSYTEPNLATDSPTKKPDPREIDKIAQLFAAMAIDQLGYQPDAKRSPVPKEIADLAASMGLSISDDTVRKYLKRGAAFIPKDWKPK
jgi:hypothetical protein